MSKLRSMFSGPEYRSDMSAIGGDPLKDLDPWGPLPRPEDYLTSTATEYFKAVRNQLERRCREMLKVLEYYGDPESYFSVGLFPNPADEDVDNYGTSEEPNWKPGKRARSVLLTISASSISPKDSNLRPVGPTTSSTIVDGSPPVAS
jgi:hypothetical protein